ncbi:thiamine phosphate synthase [Pseudomonas sp. ODNR1LW]|nr:thiamine phosphate synthase [Pseudomonas sp. ODNR1LW]
MILPADYSDEARALWEAATALNRAAVAVSPNAAGLPPLLFFTDPQRTPRPWETAARLPAGAGVVFRAFGDADAVETGRRLREAADRSGVRLLVGLDVDLAEAVGADGLHLPEREAALAAALRSARPDWVLTAAWHGAASPRVEGLDALVLSPIFQAGGASAVRPALGLEGFRSRVRTVDRPVYALGGVKASEAGALSGSEACGLAGIEAIQAAFG